MVRILLDDPDFLGIRIERLTKNTYNHSQDSCNSAHSMTGFGAYTKLLNLGAKRDITVRVSISWIVISVQRLAILTGVLQIV